MFNGMANIFCSVALIASIYRQRIPVNGKVGRMSIRWIMRCDSR